MISYRQITNAEEIVNLSDYYVLHLTETVPEVSPDVSSIEMLQVNDHEIVQEAAAYYCFSNSDSLPADLSDINDAEQIADSLSRLLIDQTVISDPPSLQLLRRLLEHYGYEGTISFLPISKLVLSLYPDLTPGSIPDLAEQLGIQSDQEDDNLSVPYLINDLFSECCYALGSNEPIESENTITEPRKKKASTKKRPASQKKRISNKTLKRWSDAIWSGSLFYLILIAAVAALFIVFSIPHTKESEIDRNSAPINYLVLSWDQTGKYGTQPKAKGGENPPVEFRIPYGVYNVLNNNSIPVELVIATDGQPVDSAENSDASGTETGTLSELSTGKRGDASEDEEDEEENGPTKVILRPNSTRQITIDQDQYLTLSKDANELILFYLSEVPEEKESDTTGSDTSSGRVVYAYVKGTEVRFRKAPSLEGQIIDALNNGQQVQVLGVTGEWTHVSVQNQKGYIFSQFLTDEDPQAVNLAAAEEALKGQSSSDETPQPDIQETNEEVSTDATEAGSADVSDNVAPQQEETEASSQ